MGINTTCYAGLGVFVLDTVLLAAYPPEIRDVPSCEHSAESRAGKHCSKCGVKVSSRKQKYITDEEDALYEYLSEHDAVRVYDSKKDEEIGWLIGDIRSPDNFPQNVNRETIRFSEAAINDVIASINATLENAPHPLTFRVTRENISMHLYEDTR